MVVCELCGLSFVQISGMHLKAHGLSEEDYLRRFPKAKLISEERLEQLSRAGKTWVRDEAYRKCISESVTEAYERDPSYRQRISETISKIQEGKRKRPYSLTTEEARASMSQAAKARWARLTPKDRGLVCGFNSEESRRRLAEVNSTKDYKVEITQYELLEGRYPGIFMWQGEHVKRIGRRYPDIYSRNGYKIVIETMGDHWHSYEDEARRKVEYKILGWSCIVVWANGWEDVIVEWPKVVKQVEVLLKGGG